MDLLELHGIPLLLAGRVQDRKANGDALTSPFADTLTTTR